MKTVARTKLFIAVSSALFILGCASTQEVSNNSKVDDVNAALNELLAPKVPSAVIHDGPPPLEIKKLPQAQQEERERAWLRTKKVSYTPKNAVPASVVLKLFRENGINIGSVLPLDNYFYNGNGVIGADGETALRMILGQMGLDYDVDNNNHYVTVIPMRQQSWTISIGNQISKSRAATFEDTCPINNATSQSVSTGGNGSGSGNNQQQSQQNQKSSSADSSSSTESKNDFWTSLKKEMDDRIQVLVPTSTGGSGQGATSQPGQPPVAGSPAPRTQMTQFNAPGNTDNAIYKTVKMGHYSLNPDTGTVTVQAPSWMLKQIDEYMQMNYIRFNTGITFEGIIVNVSSSSDRTEGIDLAALARFAGKYGVAVSNNILGGVTLGSGGLNGSASYGGSSLPGAGSAVGVTSDNGNLQIFNAYLKTIGGTHTESRPLVTVTSGVPAEFGKLRSIFTNEPQQQISSGNVNSNALLSVQNNIIEHRYGSMLRIMPDYDPSSNTIRAQVSLLQKPLEGYQTISMFLVDSKGGVSNTPIRKPQIACSVLSTSDVLEDGQLMVIGGQIDNTDDSSHSGTDGLMDTPIASPFFGQKRETKTRTTTYFAIRVHLNKRARVTNLSLAR